MSTLEERLEDEEYKLWVKAGVCIAAVKNGLAEFSRTRSQKAHTHVKTALNNNTSVNNLCQYANIQFDRRLKKWSLGCCPDCQAYVDELENLKIPPFTFKQLNWNNTDIKKWPNEAWEMMKVFMNPGQTAAQKDPSESDLSAILNFITHCRIPRVDIYDQNNISKVREARNETMHSAQMKISLGDFQKYTKAMIDLLEDQIFLYQLQDAKDAVKIIKEVQAESFCITRSDEAKALNEKTTALLERSSTLTAEIDELRSEQENIRSSVNSGIKYLEALVKNETDDRQEALDNMTKEIETKEKALKKLSVEISFVNMRINKDKALYRKMYIRMKTVEKTLRKTDKEFQGIKREHSDMKNDLAEIKCRLQMKNGSDLKSDSTKEYQTLKQVSKEQEHKIEALHSELKENQTRYEEDTRKLRTRITELEQQNEICSRRKQANASNQEVKEDKDLINELRCENKDRMLAYEKLNENFERLKESTVQATQTKLKEATEMNDALQFENSKLTDKYEKLKSEAKKNPAFAELQEYENENLQQENEIDRLRLELRESDRKLKETENMLQIHYSDINKLEYKLQRETEKADIIKKDKLFTEEALRCLTKDSAMILSETVKSLADFQNRIRHTFDYDKNGSEHDENADEEIRTLIQSLFSTKTTLFGDTPSDTNADKLKQLIIQKISDLQQNFDQEHQLRNTTENDKKVSQKTHEDLSKKIEELQKQVQTAKSSREAFEDQHKLSAAAASETFKICISDLQQKFDQEHKLRNAAENDLKASQETNEDISKRIEELQKQVQTEKSSREALEDQHKLSAAAASEISKKCISDLQQKFDQEHMLRNAAENDLKASQKTNEDISKRIEELQKQVQTEKSSREALEDQHKLSAAVATGISEKGISAEPAPGCLGTQKTASILDVIKQEGRDSSKVKACLETILHSCKKLFNDNDRVWVAYEPCNKDVPVLVAEVEKRINDAPEHASGCRLVQLVEEEVVALAAEGYDDNEMNKKPNFSEKELIELRKCMDRNTDKLLKSHSNILAMVGSDKILHDKRKEIEDEACVVIYVRTKRFIPFYEEQFTLDNNDCPLDVREGRSLALVSRLNPKEYVKALRMGCLIQSEYRCGTLAGFVELSDGKIACLTAWHIFDTGEGDHTAELLNSDKFKKNVYQPCRSEDQKYKIGRVNNVSEDFDAALIEIDKPERLPRNGHFPNAVCPEKGFPPSKPMKFDSGSIINSFEELASKKSCRVVKYGAETETTFGNIGPPCGTFRLQLTNNRGYELRSLICVCTELGKTFGAKGDSGSLVFLEDDETEELRAMGMLAGKIDSDKNGFTVVVPIWEILQRFNLPLRLLSFEEPWNIGLDVLQAHMKEVRQQLAQICNVTNKTDETVTKYMQENTNQNR